MYWTAPNRPVRDLRGTAVFGRGKSAVSAEQILILYQRAAPNPGEVQQLVQVFAADIDGADLRGVPITTYQAGEPTRDLAVALVARLEGEGKLKRDAVERTITKPFETTKGPIVVAGVWREVPSMLRQKD
jgi:hypothetical protein